jgi:hypothetical protein
MTSVEGSVEAGDLQQMRLPLQNRADRAKIVGLMQGREGYEALEAADNRIVHNGRLTVVRPAMHNAMADGCGQVSAHLLSQERDDFIERRRHLAYFPSRPRVIDEGFSLDVFRHQMRACADTVDLSFHAPLKLVMSDNCEQLELDARAAGVENQNGYSVMAQIRIGSFAIWL